MNSVQKANQEQTEILVTGGKGTKGTGGDQKTGAR